MAIRMMVGADRAGAPNVETVTDYPGHEAGRVYHAYEGCSRKALNVNDVGGPLRKECVDAGCSFMSPLYMATSHVGLVLSIGEMNGYDDSDFYAVVWNPEKGCTERITYASTRGWTYPNGASVDATPDVVAAYSAWVEAKAESARQARAARDAARPKKGRTVKVVRGRKVPQGTVAVVFWNGPDKFARRPKYSAAAIAFGFNDPEAMQYERVGLILPSGEKVFTAGSNVEVVQDAEVAA